MGEWIKKVIGQIQKLWTKWSLLQKLILVGICVAAVGGIIALFSVSSAPTMVPVIDTPIKNEDVRNRIITRINAEGIKASVSAGGIIMVPDESSARRMRAILLREDMVPAGTDPWAVFDRERWTLTDLERNVNLQRAITQLVTDHIKALDEVDNAYVTLVFPKDTLFRADRDPVTASVIITPRVGSDITENRKKIEGIQKLLKFAVAGLKDENIVIADYTGIVLNDFEGRSEFERLDAIKKGGALIRTWETQYRMNILDSLQGTYSSDRVRDLNIKIDMDLSKKVVNVEEHFPFTLKEQSAGLSYDDSIRSPSVTLSQTISETTWKGTGINPEGPPGVEGQTPTAFRDMTNIYGEVTQKTSVNNELVNKKTSQEERIPTIDRVTVSVNIDGVWKWKYDEKGNPLVLPNGTIDREYTPMTPEEIRSVQALIQGAIGYNAARGDSVTVQNIPFDRSKEFAATDAAYFKKKRIQSTILIILGVAILVFIGFMVFRAISREMDRRRRLEEEERARREQAMRDSMLMQAEEGSEVPLSPEEQARMNLYENIANMAKDHPDGVAQLIRTWLLED